ncbi:MAG: amidohydrolase [Clostridia bacterium]|nr:amidohydrolase [Clostridia bacterium]
MEVIFLKQRIFDAIEKNKEHIFDCGEKILKNPELGFKEFKTAELVKKEFEALGIPYTDNLAVTGVKATLKGRSHKRNICIIGEMDAVKCFGHPDADRETGAAHSCGHNAQIASMLAAAYGLKKSGVMDELDGDVTFFAVPAEEFVEVEYREALKAEGKLTHLCGKQELIETGAFHDIDISMMVHSQAGVLEPNVYLDGSSLGFVAKTVEFKGKSAHASMPSEGINALNAATLALMGINANRETFKEKDSIRIHPIITNGGDLVNVVPSRVTMEMYVRGTNMDAINDAARKTDLSIKGGCMAVGAECEIKDIRGYKPLHQDINLGKVFEDNALLFVKPENITHGMDMTGSTDMGDLCDIMPCIQPTMGGFAGTAHGKDFAVSNKDTAYIMPGAIMAATVVDLLKDGARKAEKIIEEYNKNKGE